MSIKDNCVSVWDVVEASIAGASSLSEGINLGGLRLFGIVMPSEWTSANLSFQMSPDGGASWANLKDSNGNEIVAVAGVSDCVVLNPSQFASMPLLRMRSGTSSTPVVQAAARTLKLVLRSV